MFTHELVSHRLMSPSQESQRHAEYGKTRDFDLTVPPAVKDSEYYWRYMSSAAEAERLYSGMAAADIPKEDARYILPNATTSEIVISANFREYGQIFAVRCHSRAHWEIRKNCLEMLRIMKREVPIVFWDYVIDEENQCVIIKEA